VAGQAVDEFAARKIAVCEHHRQRHIFVSGGDEQFVCGCNAK
jgi:hypothetical protein